ncbi:hypothetical protein D1T48_gp23 [Thermoproteus tenax virus 1]|uniref:Uncharacterized 10.5 kDa protein n=1 Tax=Thermoproteus tenax virus 1 (strain KRA1) TaxID=10480 RepID=YORK_TTV1K|nr:hypothetical protein D1T48_gp23 [Thermoproteus tenax virus 1]P19295.1 RecName: Full=Uncharacterized 10.5 kDa protein [Thermoproteus tenax virus 1 (STRAIN KRA1)]CAA32991.1 unnamed protein product [Thermoproteus tenax virus 1]
MNIVRHRGIVYCDADFIISHRGEAIKDVVGRYPVLCCYNDVCYDPEREGVYDESNIHELRTIKLNDLDINRYPITRGLLFLTNQIVNAWM